MFPFETTYSRLPERFYAHASPAKVREARVVRVNRPLAELLGVDPDRLASPEGAEILAGNVIPDGATPIALAYAGHQFGTFVPQLGDGRAILLGEVVGRDGTRRDVQLKGAGRTRFSRGGDGRAALGPVLREYVVSEAMAALGIPTTRSLAAVTTGERVVREQVLPGAILTRVATSHLRVGTFEYFAARGDDEALRLLVSYALERHDPDLVGRDHPALALLERVIARQADLVARWLGVGFVHGVMNTDNTSIAGETIDYGPCAFLDVFVPSRSFSSIDAHGRYAYASQPRIAQWNMARFAETLLPLLAPDPDEAVRIATERLQSFGARFEASLTRVLRAKIGLAEAGEDDDGKDGEGDRRLADDLMGRLADGEVDFTLFFRRLCDAAEDASHDDGVASLFRSPGSYHAWAEGWRARLAREERTATERAAAMRRVNPGRIPRNHRVEEAIAAAMGGDFAPFHRLVDALAKPYDDDAAYVDLAEPPGEEQHRYRTFCGT